MLYCPQHSFLPCLPIISNALADLVPNATSSSMRTSPSFSLDEWDPTKPSGSRVMAKPGSSRGILNHVSQAV
ncbi:uncharacterized protein BDR25DRAFT_304389 [Lindgomyces ingoldianus]|uniref:Uncharacterized protein n=1 Tax=Lindgomyces ingoldianus TaxID=673940 RepID=A0ACB6QRX2_9PLEO|nr:uncharacterized protein BDR25DRAFT_304389 [Lindgomyces ingoldianus]KAF2469681.1 hypothetical protein BDR25DRAFT_304389 [Lindgomyces ingoldianus]